MTTNVTSSLAQKNRAFLNRAKPQRIGRGGVAGLQFDGVNDYVITNNNVSFTTEALSISFFASFNGTGNQVFFNNAVTGSGNGFFIYVFNGIFFAQRGRAGGAGNIEVNNFFSFFNSSFTNHFVIVYNTNLTIQLYINGVLMTPNAAILSGSLIRDTQISIGRTDSILSSFNGEIFDIKFFTKSLNRFEVRELFFKQGDVPQNFAQGSMLIDYKLNNFQRLSNSVVVDSTQNGINASLVNYTAGDLTAGSGCKIVDRFGNPIRA